MAASADADGADPLSEHAVLLLRRAEDATTAHLLLRSDGAAGALIGYANIDKAAPDGPTAELTVHPMFRRRGLGGLLLDATLAETAGERLQLWAHGDHPSASALALTRGLRRHRTLFQMRRMLTAPASGPPALPDPIPAPVLAPGVRLRAFRPGDDDEAWLALNAVAFARLPDQGGWTMDDLRARMSEPWFDPEGFLLAERVDDGTLLGFHWTKIHAGTAGRRGARSRAMGEVYVLGTAPAAAGTGLGTALTAAGLAHLRGRGIDQVMLYVDEANPRAVALYARLGFTHWTTHTCFDHPFE
jgi:mycothiol synthase